MKPILRLALVIAATVVIVSCGGGSKATERTRNSALPTSATLAYSCAHLITDQATAETTEIRFILCDNATKYSIVTPTGLNGSVADTTVQGGEEIVVPISSEIDGPETRLIVETEGAVLDDYPSYHAGIHIYDVSLATATADGVDEESPLVGSIYPKVDYDMPMPQPMATYRNGISSLPGGRDQYISFIDEIIEKWAMVKLTTCHTTLALAVMADVAGISSALSYAQITAKRVLDRDWFASLNTLRYYTAEDTQIASVCKLGSAGFNVFVQGIEAGYKPIAADDVPTINDPVELLKSFALLKFLAQANRGECVAVEGVSVAMNNADFDEWANVITERVTALTTDERFTNAERRAASRAQSQIDLLSLWKTMRNSADGSSKCTAISAGYAVPVKQKIETSIEIVSTTLPPAIEADSQNSVATGEQTAIEANSQTSAVTGEQKSLVDIVTNSAPEVTVPPTQLSWATATNSVVPTIRVGQSVSRKVLLAQSALATTSKSKVTLTRVSSSNKNCTVKLWGVKADKVGTCRVRVAVANKGKKIQTKIVLLSITK